MKRLKLRVDEKCATSTHKITITRLTEHDCEFKVESIESKIITMMRFKDALTLVDLSLHFSIVDALVYIYPTQVIGLYDDVQAA